MTLMLHACGFCHTSGVRCMVAPSPGLVGRVRGFPKHPPQISSGAAITVQHVSIA